ncbi:MAG: HAD family hydrolase [Candidatus Bathyarchaeia archaeon]
MTETKLKARGILFDLDGTILDTREAYLQAAKQAFVITGQAPPDDATMLTIPKRLEQKQSVTGIIRHDTQRFLDAFLGIFYRSVQTKTKPFPNVAATLEELSRKAKLAVITMRFMPKEEIASELEQFDLAKYFSHIVTAMDTRKPKPSPEALIKAVKSMDLQMCECVIVGDSVSDIHAGKAAGAATVAVLSGLYTHEELALACPDLILRDVTELPKFIE